MKVALTQQAVGQGGLMSGLLTVDDNDYHWVYDCGSDQSYPLGREIGEVVRRGMIHTLFISHLDSDHVNGIERLLTQVKVREVVLPYLDERDRVIAVAHDVSLGRLTISFVNFLSDIEAWFEERGVEVLTYVNPLHEDESPDPEWDAKSLDKPRERHGDNFHSGVSHKWIGGVSSKAPRIQLDDSKDVGNLISTQVVSKSARIEIGANADWILAPFAHCPSDKKKDAFVNELEVQFKTEVHRPDFPLCVIDRAEGREKLRRCYDTIWTTHNLVSMALYAGPVADSEWKLSTLWDEYPLLKERHTNIGWLSTGDMHLNVRQRRSAFLAHYDAVLAQVGTFVLPHHGSHANFDIDLIHALPQKLICVAASGPNPYGHPSQEVRKQTLAEGCLFLRVSNAPTSRLSLKCEKVQ
jgi:hypothetical protein